MSSIFGQAELNQNLIFVHEGEKMGYIDYSGTEIVPIVFDDIKHFSEDIIPVNKGAVRKNYKSEGGKWGFWSRSGKELIPVQYDDAKIFRQGLAPVKQNGKYGFINVKGDPEIEFQYEDANPFQEDLAAVKMDGKWGFIDRDGEVIIPPAYHRVEDFDNGFSIVFHQISAYEYEEDGLTYMDESGLYGLIDTSGVLKLDTIYDSIGKFENGYAKLKLYGKEGFVDATGETAIPTIYDKVGHFSEGLAVVANYMIRESYHKLGYSQAQMDSLKNEVKEIYNKIGHNVDAYYNHPTVQELQIAKMQEPSKELMHGYINEKGDIVIDFQFDEAEAFSNGLAKVRSGHLPMISYALLDENGEPAPSYEEEIGIGANLINTKGELQLDKNKKIITRSEDSLIVTYNYKGAGAINEKFEELIPNQYQNVRYLGQGLFVAELRDSEKKLLLGKDFRLELDENFFRVNSISQNRVLVDYVVNREGKGVDTKSGIIDYNGEWILKPKYDFTSPEFRRR